MTKIKWTDKSWNPIVGCSIATKGCTNCYAMNMAGRIQKMNRTNEQTGYVNHYDGTTKVVNGTTVWSGKVALAPDKTLRAPLGRKKPTMYFVNSMGDLFHEDVPDEWIDRVFAVMALCPQHTFQILTKRAERMREYLSKEHKPHHINGAIGGLWFDHIIEDLPSDLNKPHLPLPNVWLGVSAEDQATADKRIPHLLETPAAIRFVSAEPMLGAVDISPWIHNPACRAFDPKVCTCDPDDVYPNLDWVICGGESGPNARPMHPDWARSLRDQCVAAGVPYFFKQWGAWKPIPDDSHPIYFTNSSGSVRSVTFPDGATLVNNATKEAEIMLDGRVWEQMPEVGA